MRALLKYLHKYARKNNLNMEYLHETTYKRGKRVKTKPVTSLEQSSCIKYSVRRPMFFVYSVTVQIKDNKPWL